MDDCFDLVEAKKLSIRMISEAPKCIYVGSVITLLACGGTDECVTPHHMWCVRTTSRDSHIISFHIVTYSDPQHARTGVVDHCRIGCDVLVI